jgi:hypothetical protein
MKFLNSHRKERSHLEDIDVDGRIIMHLKHVRWVDVDWMY